MSTPATSIRKLVVLKLDGDFAQHGFRVTLEIGEEGARPSTEITSLLPPAPELVTYYDRWQFNYRSLSVPARIKLEKVIYNGSINKRCEDCSDSALVLRDYLNTWLNSKSFRPIREVWLKQLMPSDELRVLIRTESNQLWKLPWHLWDLVEIYPKAEVALSSFEFERPTKPKGATHRKQVRILAILGSSDGIDTQVDQTTLLKQLPSAELCFLIEPQRQQLNEQLWRQSWDILFFAGHSKTEGDTGRIYINHTDSLTIAELKYALKKAVAEGLQLAIFNSCDGLGLARSLADLHIPQVIVMRELVPDQVAQKFLKYFLEAFSHGKPLYLAVREARERLQGLEDQFPYATWLPMICQNSTEVPPTWKELRDGTECEHQISLSRRILYTALLASMAITSLVMGVRYLGMLQAWELQAFDQLMRLRPDEGPDPRLLVVAITEEDFQLKEQQQRKGSLSAQALDLVLKKLEPYQPRAIGLNIYRDFPVEPNQPDLATRMRRNDGFFAICRGRDREANYPGISPPPEIPIERQGFSDIVVDPDGILRRHLLAVKPDPISPCTTPYSLSANLAFHYLEAEDISPKYTKKGDLQLGKVVFKRLREHMGGYQKVDAWGYQILLNYRSYRSSLNVAPIVTLADVLAGKVKPNEVKGRIVLIGITAPRAYKHISTPYIDSQAGVIVQAQMVSQILSAVLDGQPLLSVWPLWGEAVWVWGWSIVGGILVWRCRSLLHLGLAGGVALGSLYLLCFVLFTQGIWIPLVPAALALVVTGSSVVIYIRFHTQRQQHISGILSHN